MTHKPILYSDHAALRLRQRNIARADVRRIIAQGKREKVPTRSGREQRWKSAGKVGKRSLYVIYIERANELEVVTVAVSN